MAEVTDVILKVDQRTDQGKVNWRPTVTEDTFTSLIGEWSVSVSLPANLGGRVAYFRIYDQQGQIIDQYTASASNSSDLIKLRDLHRKAKRNALGIDKQLEGLLTELDSV